MWHRSGPRVRAVLDGRDAESTWQHYPKDERIDMLLKAYLGYLINRPSFARVLGGGVTRSYCGDTRAETTLRHLVMICVRAVHVWLCYDTVGN